MSTSKVRPNLVLAICCMSLLVVSMDITIVNVALPAIRKDLTATTSGLQWVIDAYTLVVASLLMLAGSLADRFGRRRTFQTGLAVFTTASALCSIAPNLEALIAFRMLQAVGASMLNPVAMSIITNTFIEPKARARAIGVWGAVVGVSMALGPLVGGGLTELVGWRSIFWINLPIGIAAIVLAQLFVPESKAPHARAVDPVGQVLVLGALAAVTYGVIEGPRHGWSSPLIIGLFVGAAIAIAGLLWYEPRRHEPMIDLRFFRSAPFSSATVIAVVMFSAFSGFLFLNALYLQEVRGYTPLQAGLSFAVLGVGTVLGGVLAPRVIDRIGVRAAIMTGFGLQAAATVPLIFVGEAPGWLAVLLAATFVGGVARSTRLSISALPPTAVPARTSGSRVPLWPINQPEIGEQIVVASASGSV